MDFHVLQELVRNGLIEEIIDYMENLAEDKKEDACHHAIKFACYEGWTQIVKYFSQEKGVDVSACQEYFTEACNGGQEYMVKYLLDNFAWEDDTIKDGFVYLVENGHSDAVEVFLSKKVFDDTAWVASQIRKGTPKMFADFLKFFPNCFNLVDKELSTDFIHCLLVEGVPEYYFSPKVLDDVNDLRVHHMRIVLENV